MAWKQPRVPEHRDGERIEAYIRKLTMFLRDFCQEAWTADRIRAKEIDEIRQQVKSLRAQMERTDGV